MQQRLDAMKTSPAAFKAMAGLQAYVDQSGLERSLLELVKIRASQINGCAYCLVMHTADARSSASHERMHLLSTARSTGLLEAGTRGAGWSTVALIPRPSAVYQQARKHSKGLVDLTPRRSQTLEPGCVAFRATLQLQIRQGRGIGIAAASIDASFSPLAYWLRALDA